MKKIRFNCIKQVAPAIDLCNILLSLGVLFLKILKEVEKSSKVTTQLIVLAHYKMYRSCLYPVLGYTVEPKCPSSRILFFPLDNFGLEYTYHKLLKILTKAYLCFCDKGFQWDTQMACWFNSIQSIFTEYHVSDTNFKYLEDHSV